MDTSQIITDYMTEAARDPASIPLEFITGIQYLDPTGSLRMMRARDDVQAFLKGDSRFNSIINAYVVLDRHAIVTAWEAEFEWVKMKVARLFAQSDGK